MSTKGKKVILGPEIAPGVRHCIRPHDDGVEIGTLYNDGVAPREIEEHPLSEQVVLTHHDGDEPHVYEMRSCGPAKVNSAKFRDGWDRIFGGKQTVGQA